MSEEKDGLASCDMVHAAGVVVGIVSAAVVPRPAVKRRFGADHRAESGRLAQRFRPTVTSKP
jgi:hypothetical protein